MSRVPFTSRSTGVLFWGTAYLLAAIGFGLLFAALWPQGEACTRTCGQRIESGGVAILLLALGGVAGLGVALWLGIARRATAPTRLTIALLVLLLASLVIAVVLMHSSSSQSDTRGLATVRSAWSWGLAVPASALLACSVAAGLRDLVRTRRARRPVASARVRRA
jgi:hypothetical protein